MAIEWSARVNRPYTLDALVSRTEKLLGDLLGVPDHSVGPIHVKVDAGGTWRPAPEDVLRTPRDPFGAPGGRRVDVRLVAGAVRAVVEVSLAEYVPRSADVDSGMFTFVTSARSNESEVLGIATVCAAADLGGSEVVDERGDFGEDRFTPPVSLIERLRAIGRGLPLRAAVEAVLAKTTLRQDYEPLTDDELGVPQEDR